MTDSAANFPPGRVRKPRSARPDRAFAAAPRAPHPGGQALAPGRPPALYLEVEPSLPKVVAHPHDAARTIPATTRGAPPISSLPNLSSQRFSISQISRWYTCCALRPRGDRRTTFPRLAVGSDVTTTYSLICHPMSLVSGDPPVRRGISAARIGFSPSTRSVLAQ